MPSMIDVAKNRVAKAIATILICIVFGSIFSTASAADPEWYVKKDTWIDTYIETLNGICRYERENGIEIPECRNTSKLPVIYYEPSGERTDNVPIDVNLSGVEKIYMGGTSWFHLKEFVFVRADGTEVPLIVDNKLQMELVEINNRGRMWVGGHVDLNEREVELNLGGRYKKLTGKISMAEGSVGWIDTKPHHEDWYESCRWRRDIRKWADRVVYEKYSDRKQADQVRGFFQQTAFALPSGFRPVDYPKAAEIYRTAMENRYSREADERTMEAFLKKTQNVRDIRGFSDMVQASYAMIAFRNFRDKRNLIERYPDYKGFAEAFKLIEDAFYSFDPKKLDYTIELKEKLDAFQALVDDCLHAAEYIKIVRDTIDYVDKARPVSESVRKEVDKLEQDLETKKSGRLADFLAVRDRLHKLRREILFSHPDLDFDRILLNRVPPPGYSHNGDQHLGRHSRLGPGITILSDWKSDKPKVTTPLADKLPPGTVRNPDLHYDADKIVFAFCDHSESDRNHRRFFLYEAAVDGSWIRQLTGTERDPFNTWDNRATVLIEDNDPCYLPDGGFVFISTRGQSFGRCHGGRYNPAWVLHRCDGDGNNIQQISFNNENEYEPSVLNDGRIVFTRWEYTNRHEMLFHMLWACRPDGTGITHFYGNDTLDPMMVVEASAIPGTHQVVATAQGHHSYNTGTTVVLDTNIGENGEEPVQHITTETPYSESHGWPSPHYSHPYAINEDLFLVSRANHPVHKQGQTPPVNDRAIYLVDSFGGREKIYEDPEVASFSPIAIRKRQRPPALPPMVFPGAPDEGTLFIQNVYLTRNDPEGLIKPGAVKAIRVNALGVQPRARRSSCSVTVPVEIPKKVLGTTPVSADGSAFFTVPARTSLQLQLLDENGMAILTEKSFFYLMPGENRSCVGCHEPVGSSPVTLSSMARRAPSQLKPPAGPQYKGGLSFMRTVQPVLDRYCIGCHGLDKTEGNVDLVYKHETYPQSYRALVDRGDHRIGLKGYKSSENFISRPYEYFSHDNKVSHMLLENHGKVNMDRESFLRIIEWMDLNAQCYGDLFPNKLEDRRVDSAKLEELRTFVRENVDRKLADQPERALINVAQIDESRVLMAPLAENAGGWGQIDKFKSRNDENYKKLVELVEACIIHSDNENLNGWEPTYECGGGESWVMEARQEYRQQFEEEETPEQE